MAVGGVLAAGGRFLAPRAASAGRSAVAGGLRYFQRMFPKLTGTPKPSLATRLGAGAQEGLERFSGTRTGRFLQARNVEPVQRWATQAAARTPAAHMARAQAVGILPRTVSYAGYAAPAIALERLATGAYNAMRDRQLPELQTVVSPPPSEEERLEELLRAYDEAIVNPQMDAMREWAGGGWEEERRMRGEELISELERLGASRAAGVQGAFSEYGDEAASRAAAIDRMAELQGQVSEEDIAAGMADIENAIYADEMAAEAGGLTPVSGAVSDMPSQFEEMENLAARDALADIIASGIESRTAAAGADRWGDLQARDINADFALQAFGARQNLDAALAAERARREEAVLMRQLELESGRSDLRFELARQQMAQQIDEDAAVRALLSNPDEVRRLQRVWRDLTDPAFWRVGPLGNEAARQLALYQSMGINTFDDFLRAVATGDVVA